MKGKRGGSQPLIFTPEIKAYVAQINKGRLAHEVAALVNERFDTSITGAQIKNYRSRAGLRCDRDTHFKPGHIPPNKGRKGWCPEGCKKSWFGPGHRPVNTAEVGAEAITRDGYIKVKVAEPNKWELKHWLVWEKVNGPVPKGYCIIFMNQNKTDCRLENLQLISRKVHAIMCKAHSYSEYQEVTAVGVQVAKLRQRLSELERNEKENGEAQRDTE